MEKPKEKRENPAVHGKDDDTESPTLNLSADSANNNALNRVLKNLPNRFEKMTKNIEEFLNKQQPNTQTKSETKNRVQTKPISDNMQKKGVKKMSNITFKLNLTQSGWSIDEIDPKSSEIQIIEVDLSESERMLFKLPEEYVVNEAAPDGSSFFDSFRQGLVFLGGSIGQTVTSLRAICAHVARTPPSWLAKAIIYAHLSKPPGADLGSTPEEFAEHTLRQDSWGEIEIHGRILCEYFDVILYVLEAYGEKDIKRSLVSADGVSIVNDVPFGRPNTIYMINRGHNNFEPLLSSSNHTHHNIKRNTDSSLGKNKNLTTKPATKSHKSSELKPSTSVKDNNEAKDDRETVTETSPQTLTSITPIQQTSLELSKEFQKVQQTIKSGNINELEIALAEHHRVLHLSQVEPLLMQLSLRDAILSTDIRIVDMVYEHWSSIVDTEQDHQIYYLKLLSTALTAARDSCKDLLEKDQQLGVDVHCTIEFNKFKIELSRELFGFKTAALSSASEHKTWEDKLKQILDILTTVIDIYDEFCNKNIRLTKGLILDAVMLQSLLNDNTTIYFRYLLYAMYENYYRKLDFCIASVILEHFHSLKLRLNLPLNAYQEIESALYYFIYRVKEDWRLYLPENRNKKKLKFPIGNPPNDIEIPDDPSRLLNGPVIYLEWEKFKLSVKQLQNKLEHPTVMNRLRPQKSELPSDEVNTLTLLPSLRDEHSLRKVEQYLEAGERAIKRLPRVNAALVVQRVLQVTGEYFKSTDTVHLSSTTRALLHVFIPASTLKHLKTLRGDFSHLTQWKNKKPRKPNLIRKIYLEQFNLDLFFDVAKDLEQVKLAVNEVIHLYKPILEKSLLREGINLIADREKDLPSSLKKYKEDLSMPTVEKENKLYEELSKLGISRQLIREYAHLILNAEDLEQKFSEKETDCIKYIITKIQSFIDCINKILEDVEKDTNRWRSSNSKLKGEENERENVAVRWNTIIYLLKFIMEQVNIFQNNSEIKSKYLKLQVKKIPDKDIDRNCLIKDMTDGAKIVRELLDLLNQEANICSSNNNITLSKSQAPYDYDGIRKLEELMSKKLYITNKEKEYLESQIGHHRANEPLLEKVLNSEEITAKERNKLIRKIEMDDTCKTILGYLVMGSKCRSAEAPKCLALRAALLKDIIASNDVPSLVDKYHHDESFRMLTESVLADICVIYADCKLPSDVFYDNKRKQLVEFPLRNFLAHGHPLLEVIGQVLDPSDLPAALFRFALLVVEDEPALAEVARLYEQGVTAEEALANWTGPQTPRLEYYFTETFYSLPPSEKSAYPVQSQLEPKRVSTEKLTATLEKSTITSDKSTVTASEAATVATADAAASAATSVSVAASVATTAATSTSEAASAATSASLAASAAATAARSASEAASAAATAAASASLAAASAVAAVESMRSLINLPNLPTFTCTQTAESVTKNENT